jgi:hypothetical protein
MDAFVDLTPTPEDRGQRRRARLAELRARAKVGGMRVRSREEILATVDWSIPESPEVLAWINDPSVGRERT